MGPPRNTAARDKALEALRGGATVADAARAAGVSRAALHQWGVRGDAEIKAAMAKPVRLQTLNALAKALGVSRACLGEWQKKGLTKPKAGWCEAEARRWAAENGLEPGRQGKPPRVAVLAGRELAAAGAAPAAAGPAAAAAAALPVDETPPAAGDTALELLRKEALSKARREHWRATIDRLKALQLEGVLVHRDEVTAEHAQMVHRARSRLLALPGAVSAVLAAEGDARRVEALLDTQIRLALEDLAVPS